MRKWSYSSILMRRSRSMDIRSTSIYLIKMWCRCSIKWVGSLLVGRHSLSMLLVPTCLLISTTTLMWSRWPGYSGDPTLMSSETWVPSGALCYHCQNMVSLMSFTSMPSHRRGIHTGCIAVYTVNKYSVFWIGSSTLGSLSNKVWFHLDYQVLHSLIEESEMME